MKPHISHNHESMQKGESRNLEFPLSHLGPGYKEREKMESVKRRVRRD